MQIFLQKQCNNNQRREETNARKIPSPACQERFFNFLERLRGEIFCFSFIYFQFSPVRYFRPQYFSFSLSWNVSVKIGIIWVSSPRWWGWRSGENNYLWPMWPRFDHFRTRRQMLTFCWISTLPWEVFRRVLRFSPLTKNQHLIWFVENNFKYRFELCRFDFL